MERDGPFFPPRRTHRILITFFAELISSRRSPIYMGCQSLRKHKKLTLSALFLVLEIISLVLPVIGKNKWNFLLGAFVVSILGLAMSLFAHTKGRTNTAARQLAGKIIMVIEIGVSMIQSIATFIYFVLEILHVKTSFNESVVPLFLAIVFLVFTFILNNDEEGTDLSSQEHLVTSSGDHVSELALVNHMENVPTYTISIDEAWNHSSMGASLAFYVSPTEYEVDEVTDSSSCEYHISSLHDPHSAESLLLNSSSDHLNRTSTIDAICESLSHSSMGSSSASQVSPADVEVNYADLLQNIEANMSGTGERAIDLITCTCGNHCGRGSKFRESSLGPEADG